MRKSPAASAAGGRLTALKDDVLALRDNLMTAPHHPPAEPKLGASRPRWTTFAVISLALLALPMAAGCSKEAASQKQGANAPASASDPTVARVNGVEIRESDLAMAEQDIGQNLQNAPPETQREQLIAYVTDIILVSQAADAKKLTEDPDFQHHLAFIRNKMIMGMQLRDEAKGAVTAEAEQKLYEEAVKPMGAEEEVHARHILVESEDEAKAILEQIKSGADFANLAKEKSKDPGAADGGDLGYFTKDQMVPEFADVAFKMYPGQLSNPVKTQFGWHIIKVEDKRQRPVPELDAIKEQIDAYLVRRAQSEYVGKLRQTAKIERLDRPSAPPAIPMPPPAADTMKK
ncbi:MAG TPA: peptidylprolyl isomerase [Xanthobacteraceae bacterium]